MEACKDDTHKPRSVQMLENKWDDTEKISTTNVEIAMRSSADSWFCGVLDPSCNDRVQHSLICPSFSQMFLQVHRLPYCHFNLSSTLLLELWGTPLADNGIRIMFYYVYVCFSVFNRCRHGATFNKRLMIHAIKSMVTNSTFAWKTRKQLVFSGFGDLI